MYSAYNKLFYDALKEGIDINDIFTSGKATDFWEQYMLNSFQFSAAKNRSEMKILQSEVFDSNKNKRSFSEFKNLPEVQQAMEQFNGSEWWLRTEYDLASRGAVMVDKWQNEIMKDKDLFPYAIYRTAGDNRVREEHAELDGLKFSLDSDDAAMLYPPNGWNCRCTWETTDNGEGVLSDKQTKEYLRDEIAPEFQSNVAKDGIFPSDKHSYLDVLPSANDANYEMFGAKIDKFTKLNTKYYSDYAVKLTSDEWKNKNNDIVFKNTEWSLNVFLEQNTLKKLAKKSRGIENIKSTIEKPHEIWARWQDPKNQKVVIMNYFAHDKNYSYIVETTGGYVTDAYFRQHNDSKQLRMTGIKLMK